MLKIFFIDAAGLDIRDPLVCVANSFAFAYALAALATSTVFRLNEGGWGGRVRPGEGGGGEGGVALVGADQVRVGLVQISSIERK